MKKWLMLSILCIAGGTVYTFPFLRFSYYEPLKEALGLTHTQLGVIQSCYGIIATIGYIPGGMLADRFSPRKLISIALISTGLSGFYFSTFPSYAGAIILHAFWGLSAVVIFWAANIKATRNLGDSSEQGKLFGLLEGGRGLAGTLLGLGCLWVFAWMGEGRVGLFWVINISAVVTVLAGVLTWFVFEDSKPDADAETESPLKGMAKAMKMPKVWIIGGIIFCGYSLFVGQTYTTPYMTQIFGATVSFGAMMGLIRTYGFQTCGAPMSGFLADRIGSPTKIIMAAFGVTTVALALFLMIPASGALLMFVAATMMFMGLAIFALRGNFFATIDESHMPHNITGAIVGLASFIGYLPDAFSFVLIGNWLDTYPGVAGYRITFSYLLAISVLGLIFSFTLLRLNASHDVKTVDAGLQYASVQKS